MKEFLENIPDRDFWLDGQGDKPDYAGLYIRFLTQLCGPNVRLSELHRDAVPNPSSFQRAVAKEAQARRLLLAS